SNAVPGTALPGKSIQLTAPQITTSSGTKVDLSGGGTVVGYEFVPGPGGTKDVFAGGDGSYAIVPGAPTLAPYAPATSAGAANVGARIVIGPNGAVPAGTYTLLPARYALMPGAFLVTPDSGMPVAPGVSTRLPDGSVIVGARLADANTSFTSAT